MTKIKFDPTLEKSWCELFTIIKSQGPKIQRKIPPQGVISWNEIGWSDIHILSGPWSSLEMKAAFILDTSHAFFSNNNTGSGARSFKVRPL